MMVVMVMLVMKRMIMGTSEPTVIDDALSSKHKHYVEGDDDVGDGDNGDDDGGDDDGGNDDDAILLIPGLLYACIESLSCRT